MLNRYVYDARKPMLWSRGGLAKQREREGLSNQSTGPRAIAIAVVFWLAWLLACPVPALSQELIQGPLPGGSPMESASEAVPQTPFYPSPSPAPVQNMYPAVPTVPAMPSTTWAHEENLTPTWYQPVYWFGPTPWDTSIEVGINGSAGTNESMSMRVGGTFNQKTDWNKWDIDLLYNQTSSEGIQTQNNALLDARYDWLLGESPWTIFVSTSLLYDEFQAFDLRLALNGGLGYQLIETSRTNLIGRVGAGASREFGGPDEEWVPEGLLGAEYTFQIDARQKIAGKVDYFPDWEGFSSYRIISDIGWEMLLDAEMNVSLKLSVNDRYDSTPHGAEPHLLNYAVLLLWKL